MIVSFKKGEENQKNRNKLMQWSSKDHNQWWATYQICVYVCNVYKFIIEETKHTSDFIRKTKYINNEWKLDISCLQFIELGLSFLFELWNLCLSMIIAELTDEIVIIWMWISFIRRFYIRIIMTIMIQ